MEHARLTLTLVLILTLLQILTLILAPISTLTLTLTLALTDLGNDLAGFGVLGGHAEALEPLDLGRVGRPRKVVGLLRPELRQVERSRE